jgi:hypothetical protein
MQPRGELGERQSKVMKGKWLSFSFINFCGSGLFKGLWREKIKNSGAFSTRL